MGSPVKKFVNRVTGGGPLESIARADPILGTAMGNFRSPTGTINQDPNYGMPEYKPITLSSTPGSMNERDAAALHDRYLNADAINAYKQSRSADVNTLLGSAMEQAKGLNSAENMAIRTNALSSINSQNQGALKALRASQAASGIRGGLAASQMMQQQGEAAKALGTFERDLVADNINYKREGTKTALEAVTNQENIERDMAAQKLNTILAIRGENAALEAARMQANAAAQSGRRGGKGGGK